VTYTPPALNSAQVTVQADEANIVLSAYKAGGVVLPLDSAIAVSVAYTDYPSNQKYDVYLTPTSVYAGMLSSSLSPLSEPYLYVSKKLQSVDGTTAASIPNLEIWKNAAALRSDFVSTGLVRQELYGSFFFIQAVLGVAYFGYSLNCWMVNSRPKASYGLAVAGFVMMFLAYVLGFTPFTVVSIPSRNSALLSASGVGDYLAKPYTAIITLMWLLLIVYSSYAQKYDTYAY
jgi:hypothetical protein